MKNVSRNKNLCRKIAFVLMTVITMAMFVGCGAEVANTNRYNLTVVDATPEFYVNDFAGLFSEEEKQELMDKAVAFDEETGGIQVVITTVDSLKNAVQTTDGSTSSYVSIEEVAYSMYNQYGIGRDDMGILVLFSTGDREVRIETGRNLQFYITDSVSGRLLDDYGMEYFAEDKFAEGLVSVQAAILSEIKAKVPSDWNASAEETTETQESVAETIAPEVNGNLTDDTEEKDPSRGILWGLFGAIGALFASIAAFVRQLFKGKSDKENADKAHQDEINALQLEFAQKENRIQEQYEKEKATTIRRYEGLLSEKEAEISSWQGKLANTESNLAESERKVSTLTTELEILEDKFERVKRLYPDHDFEDEIKTMIENEYKAEAQGIDQELSKLLCVTPTEQNEDKFNSGLALFDSTTTEVRKYITSSRDELQTRYGKAVELRKERERQIQEEKDRLAASEAYEEIQGVYEEISVGNHATYEKLHKAVAIFATLTAAQKAFFPDVKLISGISKLHATAEMDHNNYTAAQRAESDVKSIIGGMYSADEDDRDRLSRAMRIYKNLSSAEAAYFSAELLSKLKKLISEADDDHQRQERRRAEEKRRREEEERRRREEARRRREREEAERRRRSSSSFSSGSSFGGHGGRSGGGGASRKF